MCLQHYGRPFTYQKVSNFADGMRWFTDHGRPPVVYMPAVNYCDAAVDAGYFTDSRWPLDGL